jgi:hypothetical protein
MYWVPKSSTSDSFSSQKLCSMHCNPGTQPEAWLTSHDKPLWSSSSHDCFVIWTHQGSTTLIASNHIVTAGCCLKGREALHLPIESPYLCQEVSWSTLCHGNMSQAELAWRTWDEEHPIYLYKLLFDRECSRWASERAPATSGMT